MSYTVGDGTVVLALAAGVVGYVYVKHQSRLKNYFDKTEVSFIQKDRRPYEALAMLLAAKRSRLSDKD